MAAGLQDQTALLFFFFGTGTSDLGTLTEAGICGEKIDMGSMMPNRSQAASMDFGWNP